MFWLNLFAGTSLLLDGAAVTGPATQRHRMALLAMLAVSHPHPVPRERLIGRLWPDRDIDASRRLLNQAVHALRGALGEASVLSVGDDLRLDPRGLECDVIAFVAARTAGDHQRAADLYAGPLLDGFVPPSAAFEQWVDGERERLRRECCAALESLGEAADAAGATDRSVECWRRLAALEPYSGRITLRLMQSLSNAGDHAAAVQQARVHEELLRRDLEAEPHPAVIALSDRLRTQPVSRQPVSMMPISTGTSGAGPAGPQPATRVLTAQRKWLAPPRRSLVPLVLMTLLALSLASWMRRAQPVPLVAERVVVAPLDNRTGDPALDGIGEMVADWITQGLSRATVIDVMTPSAALASMRHVRHLMAESPAIDPIRALANETGAGIVVSGSYHRMRDSLHFQVQIADARRNRLLRVLAPTSAPFDDPMPAIDALRNTTVASLAHLLDARRPVTTQVEMPPPSFDAYREYSEGSQAFSAGWFRQSIEHFTRALALDSTYLTAEVALAFAWQNAGEPARADSIVEKLRPLRHLLGPWERALLEQLAASLTSNPLARYEAARQTALLAPGSRPHLQWAALALEGMNRPGEALSILSDIDPARGELRGVVLYWHLMASAYHVLGRHDSELDAIRRGRAIAPDDARYVRPEMMALAAQGRLAEIDRLIDELLRMPGERASAGLVMTVTAAELHTHGFRQAARDVLDRAVAWYRTAVHTDGQAIRLQLAEALVLAGENDEAELLLHEFTSGPHAIPAMGMLGVIAVRRGDDAEVARVTEWLRAHHHPYTPYRPFVWLGVIAAQLGDLEQATDLVRKAFLLGWPYGWIPHCYPLLDPLREHPPFLELLRPKG
jgi:DNA-binding SARP family transcriptional activator/tetratricopeptide (TPR) repeat protein